MKLKDKPLEWWKGLKYTYWCGADINDTRKINYTLNRYTIGSWLIVERYTSEEKVDPLVMHRIRNSRINDLKLIDNEWHVVLDYGW